MCEKFLDVPGVSKLIDVLTFDAVLSRFVVDPCGHADRPIVMLDPGEFEVVWVEIPFAVTERSEVEIVT